jgi:hypothetical protein
VNTLLLIPAGSRKTRRDAVTREIVGLVGANETAEAARASTDTGRLPHSSRSLEGLHGIPKEGCSVRYRGCIPARLAAK